MSQPLEKQPGQAEADKTQASDWATQSAMLEGLRRVQRRIAGLTTAVLLMALLLILTTASVFGSLANYFGGDAAMYGGSTVGAALLGFGLGYLAGRLRGR